MKKKNSHYVNRELIRLWDSRIETKINQYYSQFWFIFVLNTFVPFSRYLGLKIGNDLCELSFLTI